MLPNNCVVLSTDEDADKNRQFIILTAAGQLEKWLRCGQSGVWLIEAEHVLGWRE